MDTELIDEAIDKYVNARMTGGKERAKERFLSYAYLKQGKEGVNEFLEKVRGLSNYYIDFLKVMSNPFKGPELAWLASMLAISIYSVVLMNFEESRMVGIVLLTGTTINGWALVRMIAKKWCDVGVMIAIYLEIAQLAEHELEEMS